MEFIYLFLFLLPLYLCQQCTIDNSTFSSQTFSSDTLSPSDEMIDGVNYGKLYSYTNALWMLKSFDILQSMSLLVNCPQGWLPPTKEDLELLIDYGNTHANILNSSSIFNMNMSLIYASNTKKYPDVVSDGSNADSWVFYGLKFYSNGTSYLSSFSSYFDKAKTKILCIHGSKSINNSLTTQSNLNILGLSGKDLIKGIKYTFSINNTNMLDYQWSLSNQVNNSKELNFVPMKYGNFILYAKAAYFDGTTVGFCTKLWVRNYTGSEGNTTLNSSSINQVKFTDKKVYRATSLHFNSACAPLAPLDNGGAYIFFANSSDYSLYVKTIDNDGNQISEIKLNRVGYPVNIVAIPCGFVCMIKNHTEPNTLYLYGMDVCKNQKSFERIIMNNGDVPDTYNSDQLIFFDNNNNSLFGMEAMYNPHNGRLAFARERIVTIFAHYNHFGFNSDGSRNDHTGDTFVTFNLSGKDEKIAFSWGASHSLSQSLVFNGQYAFSSSLGDAYPLNIRFVRSEISLSNGDVDGKTGLYNRLDYVANSSLLEGTIPGNGGGLSCGRMGIINVFDDGGFNAIAYARRPCTTTFQGASKSSSIDMIGLTFYDNNLERIKDVNLGNGAYINQIQSAKYGQNIFVVYVTSNRTDSSNTFLTNSIASTDNMTYLLLDFNGNIISGPFDMNISVLPATDDLQVLNDGRVAWTFVDKDNYLNYYFLTKPDQTPTNEELIKSTSYYQDNSEFYFIDVNDTNVYKSSATGIMVNNTVTNDTNGNSTNNNTNGDGTNNSNNTNSTNSTNSTGSFLVNLCFRNWVVALIFLVITILI